MEYAKIIVTTFLFAFFFPSLVTAGEYFNVSVIDEYFCVYITDPAILELAYKDYRGEIRKIVAGNLLRGDGEFNQPWSWHLDPDSVRLVDMAMELCDGRPSFVEENLEYWLNTVGVYCPWVSDIIDIGCSGVITSTTTTIATIRRRGGGCPILKVFDGKEFVTVEKLDIHSPKDQDTIYASTFSMEQIDGKYEIVLDEAAYLFWDGSHIDHVILTAEEGECQLISAMHSKQGDVLQDLAESDDVRTRTFPGERIKLIYDDCSGKEFTFSIEGYNMKLLGIEIPDFVVVLLAIITLFVIFNILKFFVKK